MVTSDAPLPIEERLLRLLRHLGAPRAHFAGWIATPVGGLLEVRPEAVASATFVQSGGFDAAPYRRMGDRVLVVCGEGSPALSAVAALPGATASVLPGYHPLLWSDAIAERADDIGDAILAFLGRLAGRGAVPPVDAPQGPGEVAGIAFTVQGAGPPLVLFPIGLAPTQWDALLPRLAERYCTIVVGGPHVGTVAMLEERGRSWGYRRMVGTLFDELRLQPGQAALDVGCGSGVLSRWLAERPGGAIRVTGFDRNPYLLREAAAMARQAGLDGSIIFREGDAEALPFGDATFDASFAATVLEEGDAGRMLAELVRVTRPGGRVGVIVRAEDEPLVYNVPVRREILAKVVGAPRTGKAVAGCADASLYARFAGAGLRDLRCWPDRSPFFPGDADLRWRGVENQIAALLTPDELGEWRAAVVRARADQTLFEAPPYHCAVGTRPHG